MFGLGLAWRGRSRKQQGMGKNLEGPGKKKRFSGGFGVPDRRGHRVEMRGFSGEKGREAREHQLEMGPEREDRSWRHKGKN